MSFDAGMPDFQNIMALQMNKSFSFKSNPLFYAFLPNAYRDYYRQTVKTSLEWLDGYVWGFHSTINGIFSMNLCSSLMTGLAQSIKGGEMLFERTSPTDLAKKSIDFLKEWQKDSNFDDSILQAITCSTAGACPCIKANVSNRSIWVESVRQDNFYYSADSRDKVYDAKFFIKNFVLMVNNKNGSDDEKETEQNYFLIEHRYFKCFKEKEERQLPNGKILIKRGEIKPVVVYEIAMYNGTGNTNTMPSATNVIQSLNWCNVPKKVKDMIKADYNFVKIGDEELLPFDNWLGVELIKYGGKDTTMNTGNFGNSLIIKLSQYFAFYDYAWSLRCRDLYLGKGTVLLPKAFSLGDNGQGFTTESDNGVDYQQSMPYQGILDKTAFQGYDTNNPDGGKPEIVQFQYRVEETTQLTNDIIKKCATMIGVSPKMFASYLAQGTAQKTATEVDAEDDISIAYISFQRENFIRPIDRFIKNILRYEGLDTSVQVRFATPSLVNKDKIQKRVLEQLNVGVIDLEEALRQLYPDSTTEQLASMVERAKAQQQDNDRRKAVYLSTSGDYMTDADQYNS